MADRVIDNPIINRPYVAPTRHFRFDAEGISNEIAEERRPSSYFVPVPRPRKGASQLEIPELTVDQIALNDRVNQIRARVDIWRQRQYPDVTPVTRRLLEYWAEPERDNPLFFAQREAVETAIYLAEAATKSSDRWIANALDEVNREHNDGLSRVALKMATGAGKTVVMAMLIAWQTLNKVAGQGPRFTNRFLVVTPGITIRDRLRVLLPSDPQNYYRERDLVPVELASGLGQARIVITNFHQFQLRDTREGRGVSSLTKAVLAGGVERPSPFVETPGQMVRRVLRDLGSGSTQVVVLNDEAHHCYRGKIDAPEEGADTTATLKGEEKRDAADREKDARVWFSGLAAVAAKVGVKVTYDLSATPFFLGGSGYREGTLFPWVVSDFSLIDAIESGLVKIPRVPVDDDRVSARVTYLNLWEELRGQLPTKGRAQTEATADHVPGALESAMRSLYGAYERQFRAWQARAEHEGGTPPVFIVVCSNTTVSKMLFDWIAGWVKPLGDGVGVNVPGRFELFSNVVDGAWSTRPRTILVDSAQLESGDAMSPEFKQAAATEIEEFKAELAERFPGRSVEDVTDEDLLREVMNTVGKTGRLGEHIRCVVSVSMLTEGWDANTVSHILGVRAFGTQLLCEQVVGRGLRRRSYAVDPETEMFTPEYADVYGVPFQFIPTVAPTKDLKIKPTRHVRSEIDRPDVEITFPRLVGYRVELPDERLHVDFDATDRLVLSKADLPTQTTVGGVVGASEIQRLDQLEAAREQEVAFAVARTLLELHLSDPENPRPWYFPQCVKIVRRWMAECVTYHDDCFPGMLLISQNARWAADKIARAIVRYPEARAEVLLPQLTPQDPVGSTAGVDFFTTREVYPTAEERCQINYVVLDGAGGNAWERSVAQALEGMPQVAAYAKNDHLGFTIPYTHAGRSHQFHPDFLVRLQDAGDGVERTLVVEVSGGRKDQALRDAKAATARDLWVPAVTNHGGFGRWGFCEVDDPTRAKAAIGAAADALLDGARVSLA